MKRLDVDTISDELFNWARSLQADRGLVHHPGISKEHLAILVYEGLTRSVRDTARNRLGKKFFRNRQIPENDGQNK